MKRLFLAVMMFLLAPAVLAQGFPTTVGGEVATGRVCRVGEAVTYIMQCDEGNNPTGMIYRATRAPLMQVCKVTTTGCKPIPGYVGGPDVRRGFEVQDTRNSQEIVIVNFGLLELLGEQ